MATTKTTTKKKVTAKVAEESVENAEVKETPVKPTVKTASKKDDLLAKYNLNKSSNRRRVDIPRDTEVVIFNNTKGCYIYTDSRTNIPHELGAWGDIDYITLDELHRLQKSNPKHLNEFWIIITDVISDEITLEDILTYLNLTKKYENVFSEEEINTIINETDEEDFKNILLNMDKGMAKRVIEHAIGLYEMKEFRDSEKQHTICELVGDMDLFTKY